jgi:outer membrane immunogenic protein
MSAQTSAINGVGSPAIRPIPPAWPAGCRLATTCNAAYFVFGAETDIQFSGADDRFAPWKFYNPWFGTLPGRGGYALNNILFYGTVGLTYGTLRAENTFAGLSQSKTAMGWTIGAGMEVALMSNWTARAEYLYVDLGDRPYSITGTDNGLESSLLRFGINYRF